MKKRVLMRVLFCAGLILCLASELDICGTSACTEAHKYTLFGLPFALFGTVFFLGAWLVYEIGRSYRTFSDLLLLMISGASGAEGAFILIQKFEIRQWCPLCIGIASTVYILALLLSAERIKGIILDLRERKETFMTSSKKIAIVFLVFVIGFLAAYKGAQKSEADDGLPDISLGNKSSFSEVYIITDWFCPACRKAEQEIERVVPAIGKNTRIIFVDVPVHAETMNYTPYNLSFLVYEKEKYLELRKALATLTLKTKEPTQDEIQKVVASLHVKYKPLSFLVLNKCIKYYEAIVRTFQVNSTPTVVVTNTRTKKSVKMVGIMEINEANILKALDETSQSG